MKIWCFAILINISISCTAQYYLKGDVRDEQGRVLPNVKIILTSKGNYPYYTGSSGAFGIPSNLPSDTVCLYLDGYEMLKKVIDADKFQSLVMRPVTATKMSHSPKLISITKNFIPNTDDVSAIESNESYSSLEENNFINANNYPETGFALNIDRASYSNVRRFLNLGYKVPPDAVRIEEMLNYFSFNNNNTSDHSFACKTQLTSAARSTNSRLLFINLQAPKIDLSSIPPTNFVFLIDVSGSMDKENRLPLLKSAFKLLVQNLREQDSVAIVSYGGNVSISLQPTSGKDKDSIISKIEQLEADGDTPGEAGIRTAYKLAERSFRKNGNNRVILATDGDFNVGQSSEKDLEDLITSHRQSGIYLTCLGVGMGNYKDSKLDVLAKKGNGNFAYIDNLKEAEKVLITEFTKTMYSVANDAFLSVKFNPELIKEYRLIGFDNKKDALEDSNNEFEGGEIGSGHSLMAVFEITPTEEAVGDSLLNNKVQLAALNLTYKVPQINKEKTQSFEVISNFTPIENVDSSIRFAASVAMFGALLKQSKYAKSYSWDDVKTLAISASNANDVLKQEFINLIDKAKKIYTDKKKKKFLGISGF